MCDVSGEACFSKKKVYKLAKLFKEDWNSIQDEDRQVRPPMVSSPEMVDSVNALFLANRRVTIENISEHLGISVITTHKIVHDDHLAFSKVSSCCITKMLMPEHKVSYCSKISEDHQFGRE